MNSNTTRNLLVFFTVAVSVCWGGGEIWRQNLERQLGQDLVQTFEADQVHFYLFSRTQDVPTIARVTDPRLFNGAFDPSKPTIVLVPGYINTPLRSTFANVTRDAYLSAYDGQVITAFWYDVRYNYSESAAQVRGVAAVVSQFLTRIVTEEGLDLDETPVMGHSIGADIVGTTGKILLGRIRTVIGLDPANLLFIPGGSDTISPQSGQFVQVIHTSNTEEGILHPVGHVDFYANGDFPPQPGCEGFPDFTWTVCSHMRAVFYYSETFAHPTNFLATQCSSYERFRAGECDNNEKVYLGQNTTRTARGRFFLRTRASAPFGLGAEGSTGDGRVPEIGPLNATEETSVHFWLVNRRTRDDPIRSNVTDQRLFNGAYNSEKPTIVLIPGYGSTPQMSPFVSMLEEAFLAHGDYELIVIYWDAATADYRVAVSEFFNVARVVAQFLNRMVREANLDLSSITLIGHSAGAQIGGTAGRLVGGRIGTLVGLDAVRSLVKPGGYNVVDRNSAQFVMLIHTSTTVLGILQNLGHVDFYPNTGLPPQPGCESIDYIYPINPVCAICSHLRSIEFYAESIQSPYAFPAIQCRSLEEASGEGICTGPSTVFMGYNTSRSARGIYYLQTRRSSPFGLGIHQG